MPRPLSITKRTSKIKPRFSFRRGGLECLDDLFQCNFTDQAMVAPSKIDLATAVLDRFGHSKSNTYASLSGVSGVPASTLGHRKNGRLSIQ
jgi:hypothetical protein